MLYENFGTIGATIDLIGHWSRPIMKTEFAHRDPALLVVAFGTNEGFGRMSDPEAYRQMFVDRVKILQDAAPGAAIVKIAVAGHKKTGAPDTPAAEQLGKSGIWGPPPGLARVRQAQRLAASQNGWYFWDWSAAMGGACTMHRWVESDPPLGQADHVHLKSDGYRATAQQLFAELMAEYDRYHDARLARASSAVPR